MLLMKTKRLNSYKHKKMQMYLHLLANSSMKVKMNLKELTAYSLT